MGLRNKRKKIMEETIRFYSKSFRFGWCQQADVVEHAHDGWLDGLLFSSPASAEEKTASDKGGHIILSLDIMTMTHQVTQIHTCLQTQIYQFFGDFHHISPMSSCCCGRCPHGCYYIYHHNFLTFQRIHRCFTGFCSPPNLRTWRG